MAKKNNQDSKSVTETESSVEKMKKAKKVIVKETDE